MIGTKTYSDVISPGCIAQNAGEAARPQLWDGMCLACLPFLNGYPLAWAKKASNFNNGWSPVVKQYGYPDDGFSNVPSLDGRFGTKAATFGGIGSQCLTRLSETDVSTFPLDIFSCACWVRPLDEFFYAQVCDASGNYGWVIDILPDGRPRITVYTAAGTTRTLTASNSVIGTSSLILASYDGNSIRFRTFRSPLIETGVGSVISSSNLTGLPTAKVYYGSNGTAFSCGIHEGGAPTQFEGCVVWRKYLNTRLAFDLYRFGGHRGPMSIFEKASNFGCMSVPSIVAYRPWFSSPTIIYGAA